MPNSNEIDPHDQIQLYEDVLYVQEGVVTHVVGYLWDHGALGSTVLPRIVAYKLDCGVTVPKHAIRSLKDESS